jgi:hypothetical protein
MGYLIKQNDPPALFLNALKRRKSFIRPRTDVYALQVGCQVSMQANTTYFERPNSDAGAFTTMRHNHTTVTMQAKRDEEK